MSDKVRVTILGCGASGGVPLIACPCDTCTSTDEKNKRLRSSILVEVEGADRFIVDTGTDFRQQCLRHGITCVDAIIYTHAHADHVHGIDDVRSLNYHADASIPAYGDSATLAQLQDRFGYVFQPKPAGHPWYRPSLIPIVIDDALDADGNGVITLPKGTKVQVFKQLHGRLPTLGLRVGNIAYSVDVNALPEASFAYLRGLDVWIVDCLRHKEAPTHAHLEMTLGWIERVQPKMAYLTHMNHDFEYHAFCTELPPHIRPAYDGLVIDECLL